MCIFHHAVVISAMFLGTMLSPPITLNFWHKMLYDKEDTKEKKIRDLKFGLSVWLFLSVILFVYVIIFVD